MIRRLYIKLAVLRRKVCVPCHVLLQASLGGKVEEGLLALFAKPRSHLEKLFGSFESRGLCDHNESYAMRGHA